MRNNIIFALLLLLAVTAAAQETNSTTASDNAGSRASEREPLSSPRPKDFWDGEDPNFVNLVKHPFTTKKYVQRYVGPIRDRVNELEQLKAENNRAIKDVDTRTQQGIQLASEKTSLADQHALDATNKAQLAQGAASDASKRVSSVERKVSNLDQYQGTSQTEIRFRPGQTMLSKDAKDALDQMANPLKGQKSFIIEVHGFSPGRGQTAIANSRKMADSVVRYLVLTHNIPLYRIYVVSLGNAAAVTGARQASGARVEVSVLRNDQVASMQQ
jgi:outer membrane protein OmpA-like peptidoglycan-associated protein